MASPKLHIKCEISRREPRIVVSLEPEDLHVLADELKSPALPAAGFPASGDYELLHFRAVQDIRPLIEAEDKK